MGYQIYRPMRDRVIKMAGQSLSKEERRDPNFIKHAIRSIFPPGVSVSMNVAILTDEETYMGEGCPTYFPETPALLEMLWHSKIDVQLEDFDWDRIPKAFSIAWPDVRIEGLRPPACLVWVGTGEQRNEWISKLGWKYFGRHIQGLTIGSLPPDELMMHITYPAEGDQYIRCSIPDHFLRDCLKSKSSLEGLLGTYDVANIIGTISLTSEECHAQYILAKMIIHLLVYIQACPESVFKRLPDGRRSSDTRYKYSGGIRPMMIEAPEGLTSDHASPESHWRNPHFRSYPRRRDGTKRKGIVQVRGTVVNADIDPKTVVEGVKQA